MDTRHPDQTRDKLLYSAFCEIHRQGFQAASLSQILEDTGLTKGALYHHFPTKQALGLAVIDEVIAQRLERLIFRPLRESAHPVDTLLEIIATLDGNRPADFIELGCPLNNLMQEMSPLDPAFKTHLNAVLTVWKDAVEAALRHGQAQGAVRPEVDCRAVALFVVSAWEGCVGIAKNLQSSEAFGLCMQQLHSYLRSLMVERPR